MEYSLIYTAKKKETQSLRLFYELENSNGETYPT